MKTLAIQDAQIARAIQLGTLKLRPFTSRAIVASNGEVLALATDYIAVEDDCGLIELCDSIEAAHGRVAEITTRMTAKMREAAKTLHAKAKAAGIVCDEVPAE